VEPEGSLSCLNEIASGPYPQAAESSGVLFGEMLNSNLEQSILETAQNGS
jgi:hypothetical protein